MKIELPPYDLGATVKPVANVGRRIPHQHLAQINVMIRRRSILPPAFQNMRDVGVRIGRPMAGMGVVHRHHIGQLLVRSDHAGIVGDRMQPAMGLK